MSGMTKGDRDSLIRLTRLRARQAKQEAVQREKVLLAEVEDLMTAEFEQRDELWVEAVKIAEEAARKANQVVVARCADLGIPEQHAPSLHLGWQSRSSPLSDPRRRAELRKLAQTKLTALTKTAHTMIDGQAVEVEAALLTGSLETDDAKAFLESIPTVQELMPALTLDDLGVKHWQPPDGIASALVTPPTTADRKRRQVLRAIEANPGASSRRIAEIAGVDHKTVLKYRAERGEITSGSGEIPSDDE